MENHTIYDIVSIGIIFIFTIFAVSTIIYVTLAKELEFNRIWRTRVTIVTVSLLIQVAMCLNNLYLISDKLSTDKSKSMTCATFSWFQTGILTPFLLFSSAALVKIATTITLLETSNPNQIIISKSMFSSLAPMILTLVPIFLSIWKTDLIAFQSYYEGRCVVPTFNSAISVIVEVVAMIMFWRANDSFNRSSLNFVHSKRVKAFPYCVLPFALGSISEIIVPYVKGDFTIQLLKFVSILMNFIGSVLFVNILAIRPVREAKIDPITRGNLTKRHGSLFHDDLVEPENPTL